MDEKKLAVQIGKRLKTLRHSLDVNQSELAERLERTQREVSDWENGRKLIPLSIIFKIKKLYTVPIGYFDPEDDSYLGRVFSTTLKSSSVAK